MEGANDRSKYMCFMISGDRITFDSRRCDFIFPIKSVQTTSTSKGDMVYLHEGKKKELSRERERERERERDREREREREREMAKLFLQTVNTLTRRHVLSSQYDLNIFFSFLLFFVIVERDIRHQVTVIIKW